MVPDRGAVFLVRTNAFVDRPLGRAARLRRGLARGGGDRLFRAMVAGLIGKHLPETGGPGLSVVYFRDDELRACAIHVLEQVLAGLINVLQIHKRMRARFVSPRPAPKASQLVYPTANQAAIEVPALPVGGV